MELRGDVAQEIPADRVEVPVFAKETVLRAFFSRTIINSTSGSVQWITPLPFTSSP